MAMTLTSLGNLDFSVCVYVFFVCFMGLITCSFVASLIVLLVLFVLFCFVCFVCFVCFICFVYFVAWLAGWLATLFV